MNESDLAEILQLDKDTLKTNLDKLEADKLAQKKQIKDASAAPDAASARPAQQIYWFINFKHVRK